MIRPLIHDPMLLARKSAPATKEDAAVARDLLDTLMAHKDTCVGMAANMIGVHKCIIAFTGGLGYMTMLNPVIVEKSGPYEAEESCLSLLGGPRRTQRFEKIRVQYQTLDMKIQAKDFSGWVAQIIQHEVDHCNGILI